MKNKFEMMCDDFEKGYTVNQNEISYVKEYISKYAEDDKEKLLKIKAEAQETSHLEYLSVKISILAFLISSLGVIRDMVPDMGVFNNLVNVIFLVLMLIPLLIIGIKDKYKSVGKWRKYVLVAVDELIREITKKKKNKE